MQTARNLVGAESLVVEHWYHRVATWFCLKVSQIAVQRLEECEGWRV